MVDRAVGGGVAAFGDRSGVAASDRPCVAPRSRVIARDAQPVATTNEVGGAMRVEFADAEGRIVIAAFARLHLAAKTGGKIAGGAVAAVAVDRAGLGAATARQRRISCATASAAEQKKGRPN